MGIEIRQQNVIRTAIDMDDPRSRPPIGMRCLWYIDGREPFIGAVHHVPDSPRHKGPLHIISDGFFILLANGQWWESLERKP